MITPFMGFSMPNSCVVVCTCKYNDVFNVVTRVVWCILYTCVHDTDFIL